MTFETFSFIFTFSLDFCCHVRLLFSFVSFVLPTLQIKYECCGKVNKIYVLLLCVMCVPGTHTHYCVRLWVCGFELHRLPLIVYRENVQFLLHGTMKERGAKREKRQAHFVFMFKFLKCMSVKAHSAAVKKHGISKNSFNNLNVFVYGITCGYVDAMLSFALLNEMIYGNCQLSFIKRREFN